MSDVNKLGSENCMMSCDIRLGRTEMAWNSQGLDGWGYSSVEVGMGCVFGFKSNTVIESLTEFYYDGILEEIDVTVTYNNSNWQEVVSLFKKQSNVTIADFDAVYLGVPYFFPDANSGGNYNFRYDPNNELVSFLKKYSFPSKTVNFCFNWN